MTMAQVTRYEYKDHPPGHQGILTGLRACGERIKEDRFHEDVLSWAGEVLHAAGGPAGDRARAEALFNAWQRGYVYAKDPRGTERMVRAHLMLGDGKEKKPKFRAGDCDDAVIGLGAACEAVGIQVLVVGASYAADRQISHVLLLIATGTDEWTYADPSAKGYTFGQAKSPTREVVVDPMTGEVLCDDTICSSRLRGKRPPLPPQNDGKFLALHSEIIDTLGTEVLPSGPLRLVRGELGDVTAEGPVSALDDNSREYVRSVVDRLAEAEAALEGGVKRAQQALATLGAPPLGSVNNAIFGEADWQRAIDLKTMLQVGRDALQEVLAGTRTLAITEGGIFGPDLVVLPLPTDMYYVGFDVDKRQAQLYERTSGLPAHPTNTLGNPVYIVAGAVAVISLAVAYVMRGEAEAKTEQARLAAEQAASKAEYDAIKDGHTEDLTKVYEARRQLELAKNSGSSGGQVAQAADSVGTAAVKVVASLAAGAALALGIQQLLLRQRGRR